MLLLHYYTSSRQMSATVSVKKRRWEEICLVVCGACSLFYFPLADLTIFSYKVNKSQRYCSVAFIFFVFVFEVMNDVVLFLSRTSTSLSSELRRMGE